MALTTLDLLIAGLKPPQPFVKVGAANVAGLIYSPFYVGGLPGAAVAPSPGINGAALTTYAGQIPVPGASGNTHLAGLSATCNVAGTLILCDRLWHNSGISSTLTSLQVIASPTLPARDINGATLGEGILVGTEVSTVMGAGAGNATLTYTDSDGNAGNTGVVAYTATNAVGSFQIFPLAAGDKGVRSVQGIQWSVSRSSGVVHLVAFRILAVLPIPAPLATGADADFSQLGLPRLYDNTVPFFLWVPGVTTAPTLQGAVIFAQG